MRELDAIIAQYDILKEQDVECILATVVHVNGSSYRRAGARMLVDEFGNITGAISGGCLEGDALKKALHALHQQKNKLVTYDTSDEDDAIIGAQLGCNGIIQVLFEPLDYEDEVNPCELLKIAVNLKNPLAIVVQFNLNKSKEQPGTTIILSENLEVIGKKPEDDLSPDILEHARLSLQSNNSHSAEYFMGKNLTTFLFKTISRRYNLCLWVRE